MPAFTNPIDTDLLADVTNGTDATYTYPIVKLDSYSKISLQMALSCTAGTVTATIEVSDEHDKPEADAAHHDATNEIFGVMSLVATAGSAADIWIDDIGAIGCCKYARVKIVAATGGNTGDWKLNLKKKVL